jgi:hypothetical protein
MKLKGSLLAAVFFLLLGLYGLIEASRFGPWESVALPTAVSAVIVVAAAVEVGRELRGWKPRESLGALEPLAQMSREEARRLALVVGWTAAFLLGTYLFGFRIAIPVFAFSYLKWRGRHWAVAVLFAAAMLAFAYGAFDIGLKAPLFQGIVFGDR